jgi:Mce-associated membrane protein
VTVNETADPGVTGSADTQADPVGEPIATPGLAARTRTALTARWKTLALAALLSATTGLAGVLYAGVHRSDRQSDAAAAQSAIDAASSGTVALLSYAPETLDRDMDRARTLMTGGFSTYYGKFTNDVVAPAVRIKGIKASAQVLNAALMEVRSKDAKVLVFLNQETVSRDRPDPARTASSVVVSLTKTDNEWRISALDPV